MLKILSSVLSFFVFLCSLVSPKVFRACTKCRTIIIKYLSNQLCLMARTFRKLNCQRFCNIFLTRMWGASNFSQSDKGGKPFWLCATYSWTSHSNVFPFQTYPTRKRWTSTIMECCIFFCFRFKLSRSFLCHRKYETPPTISFPCCPTHYDEQQYWIIHARHVLAHFHG